VRLSAKTGTKLFVYNNFDKAAQVYCLEVIEIKTPKYRNQKGFITPFEGISSKKLDKGLQKF